MCRHLPVQIGQARMASCKIKKPSKPAKMCNGPGFKDLLDRYAIAALLEKEVSNSRARAANEKQKQKSILGRGFPINY